MELVKGLMSEKPVAIVSAAFVNGLHVKHVITVATPSTDKPFHRSISNYPTVIKWEIPQVVVLMNVSARVVESAGRPTRQFVRSELAGQGSRTNEIMSFSK
jgi:hypothetical protein